MSGMEDASLAVPVCETDSGSDFSDQLSTDGLGFNLKSHSTQSLNDDNTVEVLNAAQIVEFMNRTIADIASIIEEETTITRLLLSHFHWDKQVLLERFYEGDKSGLFKEANIVHLYKSNSLEEINSQTVFSDALQHVPASPMSSAQSHVADKSISFSDGKHLGVDKEVSKSILDMKSVSENEFQPVKLEIRASTNPIAKISDLSGDGQFAASAESSVKKVVAGGECGICFLPAETADHSFQLSCGHRFCSECWQAYINHCILNEGLSQNITCAAFKCFILVGDTNVMNLIGESSVKVKFQQLISNSFVSCNKHLRWCPAPGCDKAIKADLGTKQVMCSCGEKFCFQCGDKWHNPVHCDWVRDWKRKCETDSSTSSWLATNTKECPRCKATIEKDGGCNHMVCRKDNCMYEFCWVCMGPWQEHGQNAWYNCNRFNEKTSKDARSAMDRSRGSMIRFLHYLNRYTNHAQSMKFETELYEKVNRRITELRDGHGQAWNEVKFIQLAVDVLCGARQTLMNTYIFAYFVVPTNQTMIFEENQRDLEVATEQLSEYLERDIFKRSIEEIKQEVIDKTNYCGKRCSALVSHVQEGYDNCSWQLATNLR